MQQPDEASGKFKVTSDLHSHSLGKFGEARANCEIAPQQRAKPAERCSEERILLCSVEPTSYLQQALVSWYQLLARAEHPRNQ